MIFSWAKKVQRLVSLFVFLSLAVCLLVYSDVVRRGVISGLQTCATVLTPSLFPFMVLSGVLGESRTARSMQSLLSPIMRYGFHLPPFTACTVCMGWIGGYPVGAKMIASLLEQGRIGQATAKRLLAFCVNAGPSFLICAVGAGFLGNAKAGILLLCCQLASSWIIGVLLGIWHRRDPIEPDEAKEPPLPFSHALVHGVQSGINGMLSVIGYVLLFSAGIELLSYFFADRCPGIFLLTGLLEVTTGCLQAAKQSNLVLIGFLVSFSGLSVIFQVLSFFKGMPGLFWPLLCSRLAHGVLTACLVRLGMVLFPQTATVFASASQPLVPQLSATPAVSILLVVLCGVFLFSLFPRNFRRLD